MSALQLKDKWILVTGASSGLGRELATQLARDYHANIIIVARRTPQLEILKQELEHQYKITVKVLTADLSRTEDVLRVFDFSTKEVPLYGAILNAGVTYFGRDCDISDENRNSIIQTNIVSMAFLVQRFAQYFDRRGDAGGLLLVSSMAAISPAPYQALYSGSKAFIFAYAQALSVELTNKQFSISVFAPGGIQTEMTANEQFHDLQKWLMTAADVAKIALKGFVRRKLLIIPGLSNRFGAMFFKFLPKKFLLKQLGTVYRKALASTESKV
ncbi:MULTISPECIES: SDR family NAD(P)-dependent oxidoreductase [Chitinophagaceae]